MPECWIVLMPSASLLTRLTSNEEFRANTALSGGATARVIVGATSINDPKQLTAKIQSHAATYKGFIDRLASEEAADGVGQHWDECLGVLQCMESKSKHYRVISDAAMVNAITEAIGDDINTFVTCYENVTTVVSTAAENVDDGHDGTDEESDQETKNATPERKQSPVAQRRPTAPRQPPAQKQPAAPKRRAARKQPAAPKQPAAQKQPPAQRGRAAPKRHAAQKQPIIEQNDESSSSSMDPQQSGQPRSVPGGPRQPNNAAGKKRRKISALKYFVAD